jgi:ArsR family transcriptional regulator, arsenate/arsenite/antimonite-responsive transcriptional repressor
LTRRPIQDNISKRIDTWVGAPFQALTYQGGSMNDSLPLVRERGTRCCVPAGELMPEASLEALAADLEMVSHPIRLRLLEQIAASPEPVCVCDLEASVPVKQPTVSHHLRLLRAAGLVESEKRGVWSYYHARRGALAGLRRRIATGLGRVTGGGDE